MLAEWKWSREKRSSDRCDSISMGMAERRLGKEEHPVSGGHIRLFSKIATAGVLVAVVGCATGNPATVTREWSVSPQGKQPVKDRVRSGYWWVPSQAPQGVDENSLWGNRGVIYRAWVAKPAPVAQAPKAQQPIVIAEVPQQAPVKTEKITVEPVVKPAPQPVPRVRERIVLESVLFDLNKAELKPQGLPKVQKAADSLKKYPADTVVVEGHTCSRGTEESNLRLGMKRAEAVKKCLTEMGIEPERIKTISYGESRPIADNSTEAGREQNRRVVMDLIEGQ